MALKLTADGTVVTVVLVDGGVNGVAATDDRWAGNPSLVQAVAVACWSFWNVPSRTKVPLPFRTFVSSEYSWPQAARVDIEAWSPDGSERIVFEAQSGYRFLRRLARSMARLLALSMARPMV